MLNVMIILSTVLLLPYGNLSRHAVVVLHLVTSQRVSYVTTDVI